MTDISSLAQKYHNRILDKFEIGIPCLGEPTGQLKVGRHLRHLAVKAHDIWTQELLNAQLVVQALDQGEDIGVDWKVDDTWTFLNRTYFDRLVTQDLLHVERNSET